MTTCNTNGCTLTIGNYLLNNNKWGSSGANQSIFVNSTTGPIGFAWSNPSGGGWNYPEVIAGSDRYCHTNTWSVFPIQKQNLTDCSVQLSYKFTQKPTVGSWWIFGFDLYFNTTTSGCYNYSQCKYNFMIWIHAQQGFAAGTHISDVTDKYGNIWSYYKRNVSPPWDVFILKGGINATEPTANTQYNISIDIKKLVDTVTGINGSWYMAGLELGPENSGSIGTSSGTLQIDVYNATVNGNTIGLGATPPTPILTSISPASATLQVNTTQQFTALDQNNNPITTGITWSNTGVGSINSSGLYSAGAIAGTATVQAVKGSITKIAPVTVTVVSTKKFNVFDVILDNTTNKRGVITMQDDLGTFTKDQACIEVCNRLGQL